MSDGTAQTVLRRSTLELYKANAYDKVVFSEVEAWGRLRNQVDHGDFRNPQDIDAGSVQRIMDFILKYR